MELLYHFNYHSLEFWVFTEFYVCIEEKDEDKKHTSYLYAHQKPQQTAKKEKYIKQKKTKYNERACASFFYGWFNAVYISIISLLRIFKGYYSYKEAYFYRKCMLMGLSTLIII